MTTKPVSRLSQFQRDRAAEVVRAKAAQGKTQRTIGEEVGLSAATVCRLLKEPRTEPVEHHVDDVVDAELVPAVQHTDVVVVDEPDDDLSEASIPAIATMVNGRHILYVATQRTSVEHAWHAGRGLIEVRNRIGHGNRTGEAGFMAWVAEHCSFSYSTATTYRNVANSQHAVNLQQETSIQKQETSIRQVLRSMIADTDDEPDGQRRKRKSSKKRPAPTTGDPFLRKFYRHVSQIADHTLNLQNMLNNKDFPQYRDQVLADHREYIVWTHEILTTLLEAMNSDQVEMF